jgi:hypothetical protein
MASALLVNSMMGHQQLVPNGVLCVWPTAMCVAIMTEFFRRKLAPWASLKKLGVLLGKYLAQYLST